MFKDPEGYKLARDEYNKKMKDEIMEEGAPDRAFLLQAAAVGLGSFLSFGTSCATDQLNSVYIFSSQTKVVNR